MIQQTSEWLEMRKKYVGASDAPIIMEVSPWKTPYQLWEEKLGFRQQEINNAMRRGLEKEEIARKEFEKQTGIIVFPEVIFHSQYEWMMASLDGIDIERKNIVEIKCPGKEDHECAMDGKIPEKYFPQLQHQIEVSGIDNIFYFSYDEKSSKVLEVGKDKKYIEKMVSKEWEFWKRVLDLDAPELNEKDFVLREDEFWLEIAENWKEVNFQLRKVKEREEELRRLLISMSKDCNSKGGGINLKKIFKKGSIDYKNISELEGIDLEKYRKEPIMFWKIGEY